MDVQGWVVIAVALLLFGYLLPHVVTSRQQLAESRVEDRFSTALRVVRTGTPPRQAAPAEHHGASGSRPYLHDPRRRTEGPAVKRPTTAGERAAAEARRLAAARAARAAEISRRQAAARRRLVLTVLLLLASIGGWVAFGTAGATIALGIVPTLLLGAVLVAGRRAAKIAARRNAADRAAMARLELHPAPRTRPAATSSPMTGGQGRGAAGKETSPRTASREDGGVEAAAAPPAADGATQAESGQDADSAAATSRTTRGARSVDWVPVPVPAPTYTLKARAPRRDVSPHTAAAAQAAPAAAPADLAPAGTPVAPAAAAPPAASGAPAADNRTAPEEGGLAGSPYAPVAASDAELRAEVAPLPEPAATGGIDLDSALARRRAVSA